MPIRIFYWLLQSTLGALWGDGPMLAPLDDAFRLGCKYDWKRLEQAVRKHCLCMHMHACGRACGRAGVCVGVRVGVCACVHVCLCKMYPLACVCRARQGMDAARVDLKEVVDQGVDAVPVSQESENWQLHQ